MLVPARSDLKPAQQGGVSLWYIATRAGLLERSDAWVLNHVRMLHANEGFPPPLPDFFLSSARRREGIHLKSRWLREAVDAWFDGFLPPRLAAVRDDADARRDARRLDEAAARLAGAVGAGA